MLDSVAGAVRVEVAISGAPQSCLVTSAVFLETQFGPTITTVDSLTFDPPLTAASHQSIPWNTTLFSNGFHWVQIRVRPAGGGVLRSNAIPIEVRNP